MQPGTAGRWPLPVPAWVTPPGGRCGPRRRTTREAPAEHEGWLARDQGTVARRAVDASLGPGVPTMPETNARLAMPKGVCDTGRHGHGRESTESGM